MLGPWALTLLLAWCRQMQWLEVILWSWWRPRFLNCHFEENCLQIMSIHFGLQVNEKRFYVKTVGFWDSSITAANNIARRRFFFLCYIKKDRIYKRNARNSEPCPQYLFFLFLIKENLSTVKCKDVKCITQKVLMNFYSYVTNIPIKTMSITLENPIVPTLHAQWSFQCHKLVLPFLNP